MGITYKKLWKLLIDKEMSKSDLRKATSIAGSTITKMSKDEMVSLEILIRICSALGCQLSNIAEVENSKRGN